jgi:hypothetical protein
LSKKRKKKEEKKKKEKKRKAPCFSKFQDERSYLL